MDAPPGGTGERMLNEGQGEGEVTKISEIAELIGLRRFHVFFYLAIVISQCISASITGGLPYVRQSIEDEYQLSTATSSLAFTATQAGAIPGVVIAGWLCDRLGRRATLLVATVITIMFSYPFFIFPDGDRTWFLVLLLLFITGLAFGFYSTTPPPYSMELCPDDWRGSVSLLTGLGWPIGSTFMIVLVDLFGTENWRVVLATGPLIAASLFLVCLPFMPESPRWLFTNGRTEKGKEAVAQVLKSPPLWEGSAPKDAVVPERVEVPPEDASDTLEQIKILCGKKYGFLTCWACIMFVITASVSNSGWVWGPLLLSFAAGEDIPNTWFAITEFSTLCGCFVGLRILDRWGRKPSMILSYTMGIFAFCMLGFVQVSGIGGTIAAGLMWQVVGLVQGLMWPALQTYLAEVFPTKLRGTANGFVAMWGRIATMVAPWVTGRVIEWDKRAAIVLLMFTYMLGAFGAVLIPSETARTVMRDFTSTDLDALEFEVGSGGPRAQRGGTQFSVGEQGLDRNVSKDGAS